jgi:hypothetical protein
MVENLVCSLGCAQALRQFGIKNPSYFFYEYYSDMAYRIGNPFDCAGEGSDSIPAYTASELMAIIPHRITLKNNEPFNSFTFRMKKSIYLPQPASMDHMADALHCMVNMREMYIVNYECDSTECDGPEAWMTRTLINNIHDENPANALAKLIVTLIQDKLFVADVNK